MRCRDPPIRRRTCTWLFGRMAHPRRGISTGPGANIKSGRRTVFRRPGLSPRCRRLLLWHGKGGRGRLGGRTGLDWGGQGRDTVWRAPREPVYLGVQKNDEGRCDSDFSNRAD
ncbi:hypothetical protein Bbelb_258000 [Branchiostoma belcheri]|nr:hypothetical protein Bbelb_258000 [Branchiostoma belcheri]